MSVEPQELDSIITHQLSHYELSGLEQPGLPPFGELVGQLVSGQFDLSLHGVLNLAARLLFSELLANTLLLRQLLIIAILSGILKCLTDAFRHKSAGELGFFVTYCMMVVLAGSSFQVSVGILSGLVTAVLQMMEAAVPLIIGLMAFSGNVAGAAVFHPALFLAMGLIARFVAQVFVPAMTAAVALQMISGLSEENPLSNMADLFKKVAEWTLKGIVGVFAMLLTLQKFSVPVLNNIAVKTTQSAVGAIPIVGGALNSAMDTVLYVGQASKSVVMVALMVVLCAALLVPVAKLLVLTFTYKLLAAAIQPICEPRFVKCIDSVGTYMATLTGAGVVVGIMCLYSVLILLSF